MRQGRLPENSSRRLFEGMAAAIMSYLEFGRFEEREGGERG